MSNKLSHYKMLQSKLRLSDSEVYVLGYINDNIALAKVLSVREIASNCFCSTSVIMNLAKKLGYKGYKEMVLLIEDELNGNNNIEEKNKIYLKEFANYNDEVVALFIAILKEHKDQAIYVCGSGFCAPLAAYFQEKLMILGFRTFSTWHTENFVNPLSSKPLFIAISKSGETQYILDLADICLENNYDIISFTHSKRNSLQDNSSLNFSLYDCAVLDESNSVSNSFYPIVLLMFEQIIAEYLKVTETTD